MQMPQGHRGKALQSVVRAFGMVDTSKQSAKWLHGDSPKITLLPLSNRQVLLFGWTNGQHITKYIVYS